MKFNKFVPTYYRVKAGETINDILLKFNTDVSNVKILSNNLCEGQFVKILKSYENFHIVKPLENLNQIAKKYNVEKEVIINANKLNGEKLFIGQKLRF